MTGPGSRQLQIDRVAPDHPDAVALIARIQAIYIERYGNTDSDPFDVATFTAPAGGFYVGYQDGSPVATGAWRRTAHARLGAAETAEVKRMFVVPAAQRQGLARQMLARLEAEIAGAGISVVILGTGEAQPEAIALYGSSGYERIPGFGHYAENPGAHFFAKRVRGA